MLTGEKFDWKVFYDFLEEINLIGDKKNILLMDNARIHTAFNKRSEKKLPTTEKQRPRNYEEMKKVVELLNQKDLSAYFRYCIEYFDRKKKDAKTNS